MVTTVARDLSSQLSLIESAARLGKQLQVNKDGSISHASLATLAGRTLLALGKGQGFKAEQQRQVVDSLKAALAQSVSAGGRVGEGKYDVLFQKVQHINQTSGPGVLAVERYRQALAEFDSVGTLKPAPLATGAAAHQGVEVGAKAAATATGKAQAIAAAAQHFRPLHDIRQALSAHAESRREFQSLGLAGRPALALFEDHRALGSAMKVSADPGVRADQGAQLLSNLTKLEHRLDDAVARGVLSPAQTDTVAKLLARVQSEKELVGAIVANKLDVGGVDINWTQGLSLRRLGVDLTSDILHDRPLDPGSIKPLGEGAMNAVYLVKDDQGRSFVYKPGQTYQDVLGAHVVMMAQGRGADLNPGDTQSKEGTDLRYEARNVVASRLDQLAASQVMVGARIGEIAVENFTFKTGDKKDEDVELRGDLHSDHGLLMDPAPGKTGSALRGSADLDQALASREFKRDLSNLVLLDAVLGSFDRHPGNYLVHIEGGQYKGVKGIDNDFSLFATGLDAGSFRLMTEEDRAILNGQVPNALREANQSGRAAVNSKMQMLGDVLDKAMNQPSTLHPNPSLTPELRSKLNDAVQRFDTTKLALIAQVKQQESQTKSIVELSTRPEVRQAWTRFADDARAAGIPDGHPFWKFVASGFTMIDAYSNVKSKQEALSRQLADEGFDPKAGSIAQRSTHNVGLPRIADRALADRIRQPGFEQALAQAIRPLLTQREVEGTLERLHTVQRHLDKLEQQGRLVSDWSSDHRASNGQTIDEIVAEPGHSYWAVLNDMHQMAVDRNNGVLT
jgi:hypothetical protein